ncbi:MAG: helix-turn-helix transcriptional regulator [Candidatus Methylomirabilia bacterium]
MARGDQLSRQWRLIRFLDHPNGFTVDEAARELGCTVRTVWRDLDVLQKANFPLYTQPDGKRVRYRLVDGFHAKLPAPFTLSEVVALLMSRDLLAPASGSVVGPSVHAAFDKIRALLPDKALELLDEMRAVIGVRALGAKLLLGTADYLTRIHDALLDRRTLHLDYFAFSKQEESTRLVDPYHLMFHQGGLYLIGYCHTRKDLRIFAVERIQRLEVTDRRFTLPADFDAERYLAGAWGLIRGQQVTIKVVFAPTVAPWIAERVWHPSQSFRWLAGKRLEITLKVADTPDIRRWLLGFGSDAEVIEPAALREALRAQAEALVRKVTPIRRPPRAISLAELPSTVLSRANSRRARKLARFPAGR